MLPFIYEEFRDRKDARLTKFKLDLTFFGHTHNAIEIIYCLEEHIKVLIEKETYTLYPGDVCFVHSFLIHEITDYGKNMCIIIPPKFLGEYEKITNNMMPACPIIRGTHEKIKPLIDSFGDVNVRFDFANDLCAHGIANSVLGHAIECLEYVPTPPDLTTRHSCVHNFVTYVDAHYKENLTLENVALNLGYNKFYLSQIINKHINMNFREYLNQVRLMKFRKKYNKQIPIDLLANQVGFTSRQTFYRAFKQKFGVTPSEYFAGRTDNFNHHTPMSNIFQKHK